MLPKPPKNFPGIFYWYVSVARPVSAPGLRPPAYPCHRLLVFT